MKIAMIIVRTLMGLMFLFASTAYFFNLVPAQETTGNVKIFNEGIKASVYLMPVVKVIELLCGLAFVSGRFVTLATVVIFPIIINILLFHAFLAPETLLIPILLLLGDLFLAYYYKENYKPLFAVK